MHWLYCSWQKKEIVKQFEKSIFCPGQNPIARICYCSSLSHKKNGLTPKGLINTFGVVHCEPSLGSHGLSTKGTKDAVKQAQMAKTEGANRSPGLLLRNSLELFKVLPDVFSRFSTLCSLFLASATST